MGEKEWNDIQGRRPEEEKPDYESELIKATRLYIENPENETLKKAFDSAYERCDSKTTIIVILHELTERKKAENYVFSKLYKKAFEELDEKIEDEGNDKYIAKKSEMVSKIENFINEGRKEDPEVVSIDDKGREISRRSF